MANTIKNPITGRDKLIVTDEGVFDAITGRQVGIIENGVMRSATTGLPMAVVVSGGGEGGGSIDLSFITANAEDILSGKIGSDKNGNPVYGTLEMSGGGGSDSGLSTVTVTEFTPAKSACTGLSEIIVSGLGSDYASANGTYEVTEETERIAAPFERIYRHTSGEWYIWGEYDSEYEEGYWYIGPAPDSGNLVYWTTSALTDGTFTFEDWDLGDSFDVTLDVTETAYPATPVILNGVTDSGKLVTLSGYDAVPQIGRKYVANGDVLVGRALDAGNGVMPNDLVLLTRWEKFSRNTDFIDKTGNAKIKWGESIDTIYEPLNEPHAIFDGIIIRCNHVYGGLDGVIQITKLPELNAFTLEFWSWFGTLSNPAEYWGGWVLMNRTYCDNSDDAEASRIIRASTDTANMLYTQWYHHAFVRTADSNEIKEYLNGQLVTTHEFLGDPVYDQDTGKTTYSKTIGGNNNMYHFTPGTVGSWSVKYVAQLAIWGRELSGIELADIAQYKQPYYL